MNGRGAKIVLRQTMDTITLKNGTVTILDPEDYEWARHFDWQVSNSGYIFRSVRYYQEHNHVKQKQTFLYLHKMIMEPSEPFWIDHINRDKLDNRKSNLRLVTPTENANNRFLKNKIHSTYIGVSRVKDTSPVVWTSSIKTRSGKIISTGRFNSEIEAASARDIAIKKEWGDFAILNFPNGVPIKNPIKRFYYGKRKIKLELYNGETMAEIKFKGGSEYSQSLFKQEILKLCDKYKAQ